MGVVDFYAMPSRVVIVSGGETSTQTVGPTAEQSGAADRPVVVEPAGDRAELPPPEPVHIRYTRQRETTPDVPDVENPFSQVRGRFRS